MRSPVEAIRALHRALEQGKHGSALASLFTEDAVAIEHPNRIEPRGARGSRGDKTAHVAPFIETRDGRIASIETFDCYEPFE